MISLPSTVLESMRTAAEMLMTDTCTIEVQADKSGEMGEPLYDQYTSVASGVACRLITVGARFGSRVQMVGERETMIEEYRLVCPHDTALAVDQRITLDSDDSIWQVVNLLMLRTDAVDAQAVLMRLNG